MSGKKIVNFDCETAEPNSGSGQDQIFAEPREVVADFAFDRNTASVFDDMVGRSVPFYGEIQRMISELAADFSVPGTRLLDLGCATGTTMLAMDKTVRDDVILVGVDNSADMLEQAERKFTDQGMKHPYHLIEGDLETFGDFDNTSVALFILTLQFIRPLQRQRLMGEIYDGLNTDGALILVEKLSFDATLINRLFIKYYYEMKKRKGYSEVEIAQKREALENVLIPYRLEENVEMLRSVGFRHVEQFFQWYNFSGMIALK